jgi:hypothetical protein
MDAGPYAVSIQYGKGLHHFVRTDYQTIDEAEQRAIEAIKRLTAPPKKFRKGRRYPAPKPTVHVWVLRNRFGEVPAPKTEGKSGIIL